MTVTDRHLITSMKGKRTLHKKGISKGYLFDWQEGLFLLVDLWMCYPRLLLLMLDQMVARIWIIMEMAPMHLGIMGYTRTLWWFLLLLRLQLYNPTTSRITPSIQRQMVRSVSNRWSVWWPFFDLWSPGTPTIPSASQQMAPAMKMSRHLGKAKICVALAIDSQCTATAQALVSHQLPLL